MRYAAVGGGRLPQHQPLKLWIGLIGLGVRMNSTLLVHVFDGDVITWGNLSKAHPLALNGGRKAQTELGQIGIKHQAAVEGLKLLAFVPVVASHVRKLLAIQHNTWIVPLRELITVGSLEPGSRERKAGM